MNKANYLPEVKEQYEDLPYPPRDPEDEKKQLRRTSLDFLDVINHVGFKGEQSFKNGFRCLVAGGGTGDAVIHLAEQLKDFQDIEVIHLDLSNASMDICKQRAKVRGLKNIQWIHGSLLDVASLDVGEFDYINCSGVLHHLESPVDGLNALKSVLKKDGIMAIMVYATYGRMSVYPMQEAMRYVNKHVTDKQQKIANAKEILKNLPQNHFAHLNGIIDVECGHGDAALYDVLLHTQDRSYSVPELYDWVEDTCGLHILRMYDEFSRSRCFKVETYIKDAKILEDVKKLPLREQQALAEILNGAIFKHNFYVGREPIEEHSAQIDNQDLVPYFWDLLGPNAYEQVAATMLSQMGRKAVAIEHKGTKTLLPITGEGVEILKLMDGKNTIREILEKAEANIRKLGGTTPPEVIKMIFEDLYNRLNDNHHVWLRSRDV